MIDDSIEREVLTNLGWERVMMDKKIVDLFAWATELEERTPAIPASEKCIIQKRKTDFFDEEETFSKKFHEDPHFFDQIEPFCKPNPIRQ